MEYDVHAYCAVSDDGSITSTGNYVDNAQVRTAEYLPYKAMANVSAEAATYEYSGTRSYMAVSACIDVGVWDCAGVWTNETF